MGSWKIRVLLVLLALLASSCAFVSRVSVTPTAGVEPDGDSIDVVVSNNGQFAVYASYAENLVAGDNNGEKDIFVRDNLNGTTELISRSTTGDPANGLSGQPDMTPDGRYVVYWSFADDIVAGDTNGQADLFLHDRQLGTTEAVSVDSAGNIGAGNSLGGSISDDGNRIVFYTTSELVGSDTNNNFDVYQRDRSAGTTTLISRKAGSTQAAGSSFDPVISPDGENVIWWSSSSEIVSSDTNGQSDVFGRSNYAGGVVFNMTSGGNGPSYTGDVSNGLLPTVVVTSSATNLDGPDTNGVSDIFIVDVKFSGPSLILDTDRLTHGNGGSNYPVFGNGVSKVAFSSAASDLQEPGATPVDTNGTTDIYLWEGSIDPVVGTTRLASTTLTGGLADGASFRRPALSSNGGALAYSSFATNLVDADTNGFEDVFVRPVFEPRIDSVSGDIVAGDVSIVTLSGQFSLDAESFLSGDGVIDVTIAAGTTTSLTLVIETEATASTGPRDLYATNPAPELGIPFPLGGADKIGVTVLPAP
ncbi:MAG: TolB family protein, partial [Acidimicrobiales bacterium]